MKSAVLKYNKNISDRSKFDGPLSTIQEDTVDMIAQQVKQTKQKPKTHLEKARVKDGKHTSHVPPFLKHTHVMNNGT